MKQYINLFHDILGKIHYWDDKNETEKTNILKEYIDTDKDISFLKEYLDKFNEKKEKLSKFLYNFDDIGYLVDYFNTFSEDLSKNNLNSYLKSVKKL